MPETVPCNLCGSNNLKELPDKTGFLGLTDPFRIVECEECGLMFLNPRPTAADYERYYVEMPTYDLRQFVERAERRRHLLAQTWDEIERVSGVREGRLLEIGCGPGVFMKVGSDRGWDVCGVEIAQHFMAYAREELGLDVRRGGDLRQAGFDEGEFDVVYSSHVLEHLLDPCGALVDARRTLKPEGLLVTEVPNQFDDIMFHLLRPWKRHVALRDQLSLNHTYFFTRHVLRRMIETCGFEVVRQTTYSQRLQRRLDSRIVGGRYLRELMSIAGGLMNKGPVIEVFARKPERASQHDGVIPQDQCAR